MAASCSNTNLFFSCKYCRYSVCIYIHSYAMSAMSSNLRGTNSVSSTRGLLMPIRGVSFAELQHAGYQPVELLETERLGWSM